ncbi:MAG: protein kinase domain-containing protein [Terriglobales bacterium]
MKFCDVCHSTYPTDFTSCPKDQTPLRLVTELLQGMVIRGKYEIVEKIGAGGMATVYRARHLVFNEPRAIKLVSSRMMDDENFLKRFRNEAVITRKLQHPNAVRVDDIDTTDDGRPYMIMELVEGRNLRMVIEQEGPLATERALGIARQAASALGAAHKLGITHRDIKPDNIVLMAQAGGSEQVKVLDFGIAKLRESDGSAYTATQTGMVIGTPQYISPEQAAGGRGDQIDGRADLYSLGIVLYQMLTARLPFESDTPMGLLLHHLQTPAPSPQLLRPDLGIPEPVSELLLKCLEKDPAKRFQTAEELIGALENPARWASGEVTTSVTTGAAPPAVPTVAVRTTVAAAAAQPLVAKQSSRTGAWLTALAGVLVVLGSGYYFGFAKHAASTAVRTAPEVIRPAAQVQSTPAPIMATPERIPSSSSNNPQERRARELLVSGRRHLDSGEYDAAIRDLKQALAVAPEDAAARNELKRAEQAKRTEEEVLGRRK